MWAASHPTGSGLFDDPVAPDSYKKAVYHPAPSQFTVDFLPPTKQGSNYSYGMRICAISRGDRSSVMSRNSLSEYEIWRRWEDCLWFQDGLEREYTRLAREKKQRLLRGKGVKKNGFYLQDQAASFESLPPGPDPNSVAQDIHQHLPRLTKKGTLFRASQATINQRNAEIRALVEALYQDDLPTLIQEIRASHVVTDFFGYWRRDYDLHERAGKSKARSPTSSILSFYFSASNPNLLHQDSSILSSNDSSPGSTRLRSMTASEVPSRAGTPDLLRMRYHPSSLRQDHSSSSFVSRFTSRPRALSVASSDSSSAGSDRSSDINTISDAPVIIEEVPIVFGHNPQHQTEHSLSERPHSLLEVLPEDKEITVSADSLAYMTSAAVKRRRKSTAASSQLNRYGQYFDYTSPPQSPTSSELTTVPEQDQPDETRESRRPVRESWMTVDSAATYLEGLQLSLPPVSSRHASIATFLTTDSAEAVVRRQSISSQSLPSSPTRSSMPRSRLSEAVTLSDFEIWADLDENEEDDSDMNSQCRTGERDAFPRPVSLSESILEHRPETPLGYRHTPSSPAEHHLPSLFTPVPPSPTASTMSGTLSVSAFSATSTIVPEGTVFIKAALNQSIVILRAPKTITYEELRGRLYDKFAGQEGLPLSKSFTIASMHPIRQPVGRGRARSGSVSSTDRTEMEFVGSQAEWHQIVTSYEGGKLTLRILDTLS
ncbi:hypothetical protein AX17_007403 [Amanita inopinata Kibby_2008]|nr:hypothetical protein AX17_007403 [Amanita inopinata Kibby_2008]